MEVLIIHKKLKTISIHESIKILILKRILREKKNVFFHSFNYSVKFLINLKLKTIHKYCLCPYKGRYQCYASLHCDEYWHISVWHIYNTGKTLYIGIKAMYWSFYSVLQLEKLTTNAI